MIARLPTLFTLLAALWVGSAAAQAPGLPELLYVSEGNRLWRYDIDTFGSPRVLAEKVFENATEAPERGRDINGMVCALPDGSGRFVAGEDTGQPEHPAGWGVLTGHGDQVGKLAATASADVPDPYGCAFDPRGRLFTTETGGQFFGSANGQLIAWFPPFDRFPGSARFPAAEGTSDHYCKIAVDIGTATGIAIDRAGRVYVGASSGREILRFSPPFPTAPYTAAGCGERDEQGSPLASAVQRERFAGSDWSRGLVTYSGLAMAPNGNLYAASVATGHIAEFDLEGRVVRMVLDPDEWLPPYATGNPQGLAVDGEGTLYYTDLDLELGLGGIGPGPDGKVWRIRFDAAGDPQTPELLVRGLSFPDGLGVLVGDLEVAVASGAGNVLVLDPLVAEETGWGQRLLGLLMIAAVVGITIAALRLANRARHRPLGL